jgi:hypothetical protein
MYVNSINVQSAHYDSISACHRAIIFLLIGKNNVTLSCASDHCENASVQDVIGGLLADAKRQINRMPEYRSGAQILHFADDSEEQLLLAAA